LTSQVAVVVACARAAVWPALTPAMGMAGHSKWHNIRHKKGAEDAKRSIIFAKVAMQVRAAMDHGGNSPSNGQLANVLKKAKDLKVPKDIIERAIKKAEEAKAGGTVMYEGMGPSGVSVMVQCVTDNKSRTAPVLRHIFKEHGGALGTSGSVGFKFNKVGQMDVSCVTEETSEDFVDAAISLGADDVEEVEAADSSEPGSDDAASRSWRVTCAPDKLGALTKGLTEAGFSPDTSELVMVPHTTIEVAEDKHEVFVEFLEALEAAEDVDAVYHDGA
jgi:YebC/PmpR family DNA-binding regulatory protein